MRLDGREGSGHAHPPSAAAGLETWDMTDETNRKLVEEYMMAWAKADTKRLEGLLDPRFAFNNPPPGITPDKKGVLAMAQLFRRAFPDMTMRLSHWVAQGDRVAVRFIGTGTHKGDFMGIPATHRWTETGGVAIVTVRNGKIVEDVTEFDALGLLRNLGVVPPMPVAAR